MSARSGEAAALAASRRFLEGAKYGAAVEQARPLSSALPLLLSSLLLSLLLSSLLFSSRWRQRPAPYML